MAVDTAVERLFNFSAGPAAIPLSVLQQAQKELLSMPGCGASVMEISHRSPQFGEVMAEAEQHPTGGGISPHVASRVGGARNAPAVVPTGTHPW